MTDFKYIRDDNVVYERIQGTDRFLRLQEHKSINAAKRWILDNTKAQPGVAFRRQYLEERLGPTKVKEMLNGK